MLVRTTAKRSAALLQRQARHASAGIHGARGLSVVGHASSAMLMPSLSSRFAERQSNALGIRSYSTAPGATSSSDNAKAPAKLGVKRLAVIGGGNMAEAIVTALASKELIDGSNIVVSDPNTSTSHTCVVCE